MTDSTDPDSPLRRGLPLGLSGSVQVESNECAGLPGLQLRNAPNEMVGEWNKEWVGGVR
jgi:hypothetical protein